MNPNRFKFYLLMSIILTLTIGFFNVNKALAVSGSQTVYFSSSQNSNRSQTVNIPNLLSVDSVSVNTGSVSHSKSGDNVTLNVWGGSYVYTSQYYDPYYYSSYVSNYLTSSTNSFPSTNYYSSGSYTGTLNKNGSSYLSSGSYTPSDTKYVEKSVFGTCTDHWEWDGSKWLDNKSGAGATWNGSRTYYYNEGGYSGTLNKIKQSSCTSPYPSISGPKGVAGMNTDTQGTMTATFGGNVTKPAVDTRIYRQDYSGYAFAGGYATAYYYAYDVYMNYTVNSKPTLTLDTSKVKTTYSDKTGYNTIEVSGTFSDADPNDTLTVKYQLDGKTGTFRSGVVSNSGSVNNFSGTVTVDASVGEGSKSLRVWVEDNNSGRVNNFKSDERSVGVLIDKTRPTITHTLTPSTWTNDKVLINVTASDPAGVKEGQTQSKEVDSNGTYDFYVKDQLDNDGYRQVTVGNIDKVAPTVSLSMNGNSTYAKSYSTSVTVTDTKDGSLAGSGVNKIEYVWSKTSKFPSDSFQSITSGSTITTPVGVTGDYYLHVKAVDNLGNEREFTSQVYKLDNTPPDAGNISVSPDGVGKLKVTAYGASDEHAGFGTNSYSFKRDSGTFTAWMNEVFIDSALKGNTEYGYTFKVRDKLGNESIVNIPVKETTLSNNPLGLVASGLDKDFITFNLTEDNNSAGSEYKIYVKDSLGNTVGVDSDWSNLLTGRKVSSLDTNTKYSVWAGSRNNKGVETDPHKQMITTIYTGAEIPSLELSSITATSINLNIDKKSNNDSVQYLVQRSTRSDFASGLVTVKNWSVGVSISDLSLASGTEYFYRVKARNSSNVETAWSEVFNFKTKPTKVVLKSLTPVAYNGDEEKTGLKVSWNAVTGTDKYIIYRDDEKVGEVNSSTFEFTENDLEWNNQYFYSVSAINSGGEGDKSNSLSTFTRAHSAVDATITDLNDKTVTFTILNDSRNSTDPSHKLEVRRKGTTIVANSPVDVYSKSTQNRKLSGLTLGQAYELWVITRNESGLDNPAVRIIDEFYMNRPPEIKLELGKTKYSAVDGYNKIQVRGQVKDPDTIPVGDPLKIYYTIKKSNGTDVVGHVNKYLGTVTATGSFQNISYDIDVDDILVEGNYKIVVTVVDDQNEKAVDTKDFLIDKSKPEGSLKQINGPYTNRVELEIFNVDANIAELEPNGYLLQRKTGSGSFVNIGDWTSSMTFDQSDLESNTKYTYRIKLKDQAGNENITNEVTIVTSPSMVEKEEYFLKTDPSTIVLQWKKAITLDSEVKLEIKRNGAITAILESGSFYNDDNLDYERDYEYELIAVVTDSKGNRVESVPVNISTKTGQPLMKLELFGDLDSAMGIYTLYKTVFSDEVSVKGNIFYKPGGTAVLSLKDKVDEKTTTLRVAPYVTSPFTIVGNFDKGQNSFVKAVISEDTLKREVKSDFVIKEKSAKVQQLSKEKYSNIFK